MLNIMYKIANITSISVNSIILMIYRILLDSFKFQSSNYKKTLLMPFKFKPVFFLSIAIENPLFLQ